MLSILVANPKGGSGKSTLSTQLAGYYACQGKKVMLGDVDRQQSSLHWLTRRPPERPAIAGWEIEPGAPARAPKGTELVVLDTPAGLKGKKLAALLGRVDRILVPIQPSPFDMWASEAFLEGVLEEKALRKQKAFLAVVGMRVDPRTRSARELEQFLARHDVPVLTWLRDTQLYVQTATAGLTLFDLPPSRTARDRAEWQPIIDWLTPQPSWCDK
ncbi:MULTISPECIES: ParA family protein [Gulbenkiania]|uniref:Cellulose biosynthesis protein BcsQ n=2 Tax=Gulbenkiania TaxID=397456 RepID=A0A0K6H0H0_9NEIS|nr:MULTISPECIES: ParA family protein [Gulbenkiania]TCW31520.1 chromosome partitioning protein [Gulbenkiania mobilis]CUA84321.1 Cellulose biosynthesis protein BcsQ [Gulbenkiania indica]